MVLTSMITAAAETSGAAVISPWAVGGIALGLLLVLMLGLLMFGRGREHS